MKNFISRSFLQLILLFFIYEPVFGVENIHEFQWENRILLIRSESNPENIISALKKVDLDIQDRHIFWFIFSDDNVSTNFKGQVHKYFYSETITRYFQNEEVNVVLVGKDGGIKKQALELDLQKLFDLIDEMPMRKREIAK